MSDPRRSALLHRALVAYRSADDELAESLAKQVLKIDGSDVDAHMLLGSLYGRMERPGQAITQFYKALEVNPDNSEAWNNIGVMHRAQGELPESLDALEKARDLDPDNAGVLYNLGNVLKQAGKLDEAVEAYESSLKKNSNNPAAYNNLGTIYENRGDLDKAQDTYQRGLENDSNNPTLRYNLGLVYQRRNEFRLARMNFETALRGKPGWKAGLNNLGVTLHKMGQQDEALALFQEMIQDDPTNPEALNNLGVVYQELGRPDDAEAQFTQALKVNPRYGRAVLNLDSLYAKEGKTDQSMELLSRYSQLEPDNTTVRLQLAKLRMFQNSPVKAEEDLLAVLAKEPSNLDALRTLGNLYLKTKRAYLAQKVSDRIRRIDPSSVDLQMDMALFSLNEGETGAAMDHILAFLKARPRDVQARLLLANLYHKQHRLEEARKILLKLLDEDPQNTAVLGALSRIANDEGDQKTALELADRILRVQGKDNAVAELELMAETLEMYEKAADTLGADLQEIWQRNLRSLVEPLTDEATTSESLEEQPIVEEPAWMHAKVENDPPSLLELGDLNPIIQISEETESLTITEEEEILGVDEAWDEEELEADEADVAVPVQAPIVAEAPMPPAAPVAAPPPYPYYPPPPYPPWYPPYEPVRQPEPARPEPEAPPRPSEQPKLAPEPDSPEVVHEPQAEVAVEPWPEAQELTDAPLPEVPEMEAEPEELPLQDWDDVVEDPLATFDPEVPIEGDVAPSTPSEDDSVAEPAPNKIADLIGYLEALTDFLPEDKKQRLIDDTMTLKMKKIRSTLTPERRTATRSPWPSRGEAAQITRRKLEAITRKLKEKLAE